MGKKGFTLIELLVVISIIALLMAVLIPALQAAKETAQGILCVSNLHTLSMAWFTYTVDNEGKLVGGQGVGEKIDNPATTDVYEPGEWVWYPISASGNSFTGWGPAGAASLADKQRVIEYGALFPYVKNIKVYHCLGDKRYKKPPEKGSGTCGGYRSYSIVGGMNGELFFSTSLKPIKVYPDIKAPAEKIVFVEDNDPRGWNCGSWVLALPSRQGGAWPMEWHDPVALYHHNKGSLGFADGHALMRRWRDKRTTIYAEESFKNDDKSLRKKYGENNPDLRYLQECYPYK